MFGKYQINDNLLITTRNKHHPKTVCIEGHYWLEPTDSDIDVLGLWRRLEKMIKKQVPESISIFDLPDFIKPGKRSCLQFQIHIKNSLGDFKSFSERITPVILNKKAILLNEITNAGFIVHLTKKS